MCHAILSGMFEFIAWLGVNLAYLAVLVAIVIIPVRIWEWYKGDIHPR